MKGNINKLIEDFTEIAKITGLSLLPADIEIEAQLAPHQPPIQLPRGKVAVYIFCYNSHTLKVGRVGPKSTARYASQHYNPGSSNSNLAKSLCLKSSVVGIDVNEDNVNDWIKMNVDRYNLLLPETYNGPPLNLLEAFIQCKLNPEYEGR